MINSKGLLIFLVLIQLNQLVFASNPDGVCWTNSRWSDPVYSRLRKACRKEIHEASTTDHDHDQMVKDCIEDLNQLWKNRVKSDVDCCKGYKKNNNTLTCEAICPNGCKHGVCVKPNECACAVNFGGPDCAKNCTTGTFGPDCEHSCKELLDEEGAGDQEACFCHDPNKVNSGCRNLCECKRSFLCAPGWIGKDCSKPCPPLTFGPHCSKNCTDSCEVANTRSCAGGSGACKCKPEYYGDRCELHCIGTVECEDDDAQIGCECKLTLEQKVDLLAKEKVTREEKEASERKARIYFISSSVLLLLVLIVLCALVYNLKRGTNKLKRSLELGTAHYSNKPDEFGNPIYEVSLSADAKGPLTPNAVRAFRDKFNSLFNLKGDETKLTIENQYETIQKSVNQEVAVKKTDCE